MSSKLCKPRCRLWSRRLIAGLDGEDLQLAGPVGHRRGIAPPVGDGAGTQLMPAARLVHAGDLQHVRVPLVRGVAVVGRSFQDGLRLRQTVVPPVCAARRASSL